MATKPILLIDMDGVVTNYYLSFLLEWVFRYKDRPIIRPENLETFYIEDAYGSNYAKDILQITRSKGFFETMDPVAGAVKTLQNILASGKIEPFLCTAPDLDVENQVCFTEKAKWTEHHLGRQWLERLIITKDKTVIGGDYLIDDKPLITGVNSNPSWKRIVFTHAYNKNLGGLRLNNWQEWPVLQEELLRDFSMNQFRSKNGIPTSVSN